MDDLIEIGVVTRPHGVRGELRVHLYNPDSTAFDTVETVFLGDTAYELSQARVTKGAVLLRLAEVKDRNMAETLRQAVVSVPRDQLELEEDDVILADLIGLEARLEDGSSWGKVVDVVVGAQDRLVIHEGEVERQLPVVDEFVLDVDFEAGAIVLRPPEGLPEWPVEPR